MRIETVDPEDDAAFAAWFAVVDAVDRDLRAGEPQATATARRALLRRGHLPSATERVVALLVRDGDHPVAAATLELPLRDNQHYAELDVSVLPVARRRGLASRLLREVEQLAREAGRDTVGGGVDEPPGAPTPGRAFAAARGYAEVLVEVRRDIDLPPDLQRARDLDAACAPYAEGFSVRTWEGGCPDDLVDDLALLLHRMSTDAPSGDADWREEHWDTARVRAQDALVAAQGRRLFAAGAVHDATGRLVAFTRVAVEAEEPSRAFQWETLVLAEHRGARLGTVVKLACLQSLAERSPATRYVSTWNATANGPMIRINDALGARTNGAMSFWERRLDG